MFEKSYSKLVIKKIEPNWANAIKISSSDFNKNDLKEFLDKLQTQMKNIEI